jgi:hypothetical protein
MGLGPEGLAYAIVLHGVQVIWYIGMGAIALATPYVSLTELWESWRRVDDDFHRGVPESDVVRGVASLPRESPETR